MFEINTTAFVQLYNVILHVQTWGGAASLIAMGVLSGFLIEKILLNALLSTFRKVFKPSGLELNQQVIRMIQSMILWSFTYGESIWPPIPSP